MDLMEQTSSIERDFLLQPSHGGRPMHAIAIEICTKYGVTIAELRSRRRSRYLAWPRQEFWYRCKKETPATYAEMGQYLERSDHTTVLKGIRRYEARMKEANG